MSKIFIISGNSATGKTFILNRIKDISEDLLVVKKITTREIREQEKTLTDYDLQFGFSVDDVKKSDFYYSHRDEWYGINKKDIDAVLDAGKNAVFAIRRVSTILDIKRIYSDKVVTILFQSCFSKNELISFLLERNITEYEINARLADRYENECQEEYRNNIYIFNNIIINSYDGSFFEEVKKCIVESIIQP